MSKLLKQKGPSAESKVSWEDLKMLIKGEHAEHLPPCVVGSKAQGSNSTAAISTGLTRAFAHSSDLVSAPPPPVDEDELQL